MRRARQETKALLDAGHNVIVITDLKWKSSWRELERYKKRLYILPLNPFYIPRPFHIVSSQLSFSLKIYYALKRIAEKKSIDLIVSHFSTACYAIARFAKKRNIPSVWVIQDLIKDRMATGNPYNLIETKLFLHSNPYALKNMSYIISVSKYSRKLAIIDGAKPENTFIKHNSINTNLFLPSKDINKDIDILFFGRLSIEKGVKILIDATQYLSRKRNIVIIGEGPLENMLKRQTKNIYHDIKFKGFINHELLPQYIRRAKVVVAPSLSECHAAVPMEAMACGVPVIASRVSGMEDTIDNKKNGWLLPHNNSETLGKLIEEVLSDEQKLKQVSQAALKKSEFFSETRFNHEIVELYKMLVEKHKNYHN